MGYRSTGPAVRGPKARPRRRPLCRRHDVSRHRAGLCPALAARACANQVDRRLQGQGRPWRAGGADRRGLGQVRLRRPAGAGRPEAPRRIAALPAALPRAGQGPGALGRRLCRLRGRRDGQSGDGRGRADRGRLRAAAGHHFDRATRSSPAPRWSGTTAPTTSASCIWKATRPRPTPRSRKRPMSSSITS